ncbi:hypothetical protein Tco_1501896 [Tanacetum coccineum]
MVVFRVRIVVVVVILKRIEVVVVILERIEVVVVTVMIDKMVVANFFGILYCVPYGGKHGCDEKIKFCEDGVDGFEEEDC